MKRLASQNRQPEASGLGKPPPLSERAPLMLLRLARISPILETAKAGKDFSFFFSPQQKAEGKANTPEPKTHTAKAGFDNFCHFCVFYLKPN